MEERDGERDMYIVTRPVQDRKCVDSDAVGVQVRMTTESHGLQNNA